MILVDTSVWVHHLHAGDGTLTQMLDAGQVLMHPFVIGELALVVAMPRPATAVALEPSSVLRISRSLFQRVLESHPEAALRLRDDFAARSNAALGAMTRVGATLR